MNFAHIQTFRRNFFPSLIKGKNWNFVAALDIVAVASVKEGREQNIEWKLPDLIEREWYFGNGMSGCDTQHKMTDS